MKKKRIIILSTVIMLFITNLVSAQLFKISAFGQNGIITGDFAKREINSKNAGYVDYGFVGGIELNYYFNNKIGLGLRWTSSEYERNTDTYQSDLLDMLGITNDHYDLTQSYSFWAFGSDIGISYQMNISEKLQLEPYIYLGYKGLISPGSEIIFSQDNTTFQYKTKSQAYLGFSYSPGLKLNWNVWKHFGFFFSAEYDASSFVEDDERSLLFSYDTFEITDTQKSYTINSVNIGVGLSFRFGKGLHQ
ncbi:outer membrane beta-barrel protein [Maribellus sediminis]|uniref:outer membrane beta-barrel protein n=1 Tax=Maribellus sediminis TaxID=2696285 RepID=UPI00142F9564|nr:outer membrane beta-barrel protein [Maribellus sediminis]